MAKGGDGRATSGRHTRPRRIEAWRLVAAGVVVVLMGSALWLWGRPDPPPPTATAIAATEAWQPGQPFGPFELLQVPAELAERLVSPNDLQGQHAAVAVPAGVLVSPAMLTEPSQLEPDQTRIQLAANTGLWPPPGPQSGTVAVFAAESGGCALHVAELVGGGDGEGAGAASDSVTIRADAALALRLSRAAQRAPLWVWEAPAVGWPGCDGTQVRA